MARHLDLEEQEQLDDLKHFWKNYGNLITWLLIVGFGAVAAWNGWQYWQRTQALQASVLYEEVEKSARDGDADRIERVFGDMRDKFGRTTYAQQSALLAAKTLADKGRTEPAKAALTWLAEKGKDEGYQAVARLRLAGMLADAKAYDEAMKHLNAGMPAQFEALAADRRGDILQLQGKKAEAKAEYTKAYQAIDERAEYRQLIAVKLTALGVDPQSLKPASSAATAPAASGAAKP
ncbi:YfgM family protein [Ramlibacter sp.]|uniref:YfgM family protein n=1 Tax=Ramlibacter sp. TaxID=1917967 RepID=UPI003D0FFF4E